MTLRIKDKTELGHVGSHVRSQLVGELGGARPGRLNRPEQRDGAMLVQWMDHLRLPCGGLAGLYFAHTPNGGARSAVEGAILQGQGVRKGWPDYTLYYPHNGYAGLVLELKHVDGAKPDDEQLQILERLERVGYKAHVAWGFDDATRCIQSYLD